jgi:hypothetical protein
VKAPLARRTVAGETFTLKILAQVPVCSEGSNFCTVSNVGWVVPVTIVADGPEALTIPTH